ncbi:hypothetical protein EUGRSUZ_H00757 [Eucalyptus grandis]|uniref:Uncharacterized protein n=2 Tax=Eucalyptus grandis TaxID=71139 RepID=A0ACC3JMA4_EUCGR|nr:hypothetical protein EUGRSUZ_H00757 [Eucalyptus grandis]
MRGLLFCSTIIWPPSRDKSLGREATHLAKLKWFAINNFLTFCMLYSGFTDLSEQLLLRDMYIRASVLIAVFLFLSILAFSSCCHHCTLP